MAPYYENGSLTSSKMTINDSDGWDSQTDWEAYQSASNVEIVNGAVQLAEITTMVIDNFEGAPDGPYESGQTVSEYYSGQPSEFSRQQSIVQSGSYALERPQSSFDRAAIYSEPGGQANDLPSYPSRGDTVRGYWYNSSDAENYTFIGFAISGGFGGDGYYVELDSRFGALYLTRIDGGSDTQIASDESVTWGSGWHEVIVEYGVSAAETIRVVVLNPSGSVIADISATDSQYTVQGFGISQDSDTGSTQYYDTWRIEPYNG